MLESSIFSIDQGYNLQDMVIGNEGEELFCGGEYAFFFYKDVDGKLKFFNAPCVSHGNLWKHFRKIHPYYKNFSLKIHHQLTKNGYKITSILQKENEDEENEGVLFSSNVIQYAGILFANKKEKTIDLVEKNSQIFNTQIDEKFFSSFITSHFPGRKVFL
jgi:hypothetical protein